MSVYIESSPRPRVSQFAVPCVANRHLSVATGTRSRLTAWLTGLCLLTALAASFRAEAQCDPPPSGITDFWEGDGSTLDVVGGNNGILMSNATDTAVGKVNQAFGFDGVRSFVEIPDAPAFHPTNFTFEAWVNFTSLTSTVSGGAGTGEQYIIFKQNTRTNEFEAFALEKLVVGSSQVFHFLVNGTAGVPAQINSVTTIATNTWYHVACVRGSNFVQLYVNGVMQAQTNVSFPQNYGVLPLYFGTTAQSYDGKFSGRLDEVSLYNRPLASNEIAAIYAAGASGKCRPPTNDAFANATVLTGFSNTVSGSNVYATWEFGESGLPTFQPSGGASVWWDFTPTNNGTLSVNINTNFAYPYLVALYSGSAPSNLVLLGDNVRDIGNQDLEQLLTNAACDVQTNTPCHISVDTYDGSTDSGAFSLHIIYTSAPSNDDFAARTVIPAGAATITGLNVAASLEPGEPAHSGNSPGRSVWWTWTPASNQPVTLTTYGSTFDTVLDVYTNSSLSTLSLLVGDDNCLTLPGTNGPSFDSSSRVSFNAVGGVPYQIAVSGATNDSGNVFLNFANVAIQSIGSVVRTVQTNDAVTFSTTLQITNMRPTVTGPLRIQLIARAGYVYAQFESDGNPAFLGMLDAPDEGIGTISFPASGTMAANSSSQITVSGQVDPPYLSSDEGWGFGRVVVGVLQEEVGGQWNQLDGRMILAGQWPPVGGYNGPGGGVITLNSGFGLSASNPGALEVEIGPPLALRLGGAWRVSPTNYGSLGELRFFTNFTSNSYTLAVESSNFTIEVMPVPTLMSPSNETISITPGEVVPLNLYYIIPSPILKYNPSNGLSIAARTSGTGMSYNIQDATASQMAHTNWQSLTNLTLNTTNFTFVSNTLPAGSNLFYRALWNSQ